MVAVEEAVSTMACRALLRVSAVSSDSSALSCVMLATSTTLCVGAPLGVNV